MNLESTLGHTQGSMCACAATPLRTNKPNTRIKASLTQFPHGPFSPCPAHEGPLCTNTPRRQTSCNKLTTLPFINPDPRPGHPNTTAQLRKSAQACGNNVFASELNIARPLLLNLNSSANFAHMLGIVCAPSLGQCSDIPPPSRWDPKLTPLHKQCPQ